jgi:hypothetical protein
MKKLLTITAGLGLMAVLFSASRGPAYQTGGAFEGTIDFIQFNGVDTTYYKYYIKGNHIKIDNVDPKTNNIEGNFLIDLSTKKMTALSPPKKIYFDQPSGPAVQPAGKPAVSKTGKTKTINGYKCNEYLVLDQDEGLKIHFWLASGHFDFFGDMLKILNRKDKFSEYFLVITDTKGMFPMLAEEEDLAGNPKGFMKAVKMDKGAVAADAFEIPKGYKEFKK